MNRITIALLYLSTLLVTAPAGAEDVVGGYDKIEMPRWVDEIHCPDGLTPPCYPANPVLFGRASVNDDDLPGFQQWHNLCMGDQPRPWQCSEEWRRYFVYDPDSRDPDNVAPVVFVLQGGGGKSPYGLEETQGWMAKAEAEGFIAVYPQGLTRNPAWNTTTNEPPDDVAFIEAVLREVTENYRADATRAYIGGISNGALMSMRVACESTAFAAYGIVLGTFERAGLDLCQPTAAYPMIMLNGTHDPAIPWDGRGNVVVSVPATRDFWVQNGGCDDTVFYEIVPNNAADGMRTSTYTWTRCADGMVFTFVPTHYGEHAWPGGLDGSGTQDFRATDMLWEFYQSEKKGAQGALQQGGGGLRRSGSWPERIQ